MAGNGLRDWEWQEEKHSEWALAMFRRGLLSIRRETPDWKFAVAKIGQMQVDATTSIRKGRTIAMFTASAKALWTAQPSGSKVPTIGGMVRFEDATQDDAGDAEVVTERLAAKVSESTQLGWDSKVAVAAEAELGAGVRSLLRNLFDGLVARANSTGPAKGGSDATGGDSGVGAGPGQAVASDEAPVVEPSSQQLPAEAPSSTGVSSEGALQPGMVASSSTGPSATTETTAGGTSSTSSSGSRDAAGAAAASADGSAPTVGIEDEAADHTGEDSRTSFEWEETSLSDWARERLSVLLKEVEVELPGLTSQIVEVDSLRGDAGVSKGRGRTVLFYEVQVKGKWDAEEVNDEGVVLRTGDGEFKIGQFDHDAEPDDVVVEVLPAEDGGSTDKELCDRVQGHLERGIRRAVALFRAEIATK